MQRNAAAAVRRVLQTLEDRQFQVELDNGARLQPAISGSLSSRARLISAAPQLRAANFHAGRSPRRRAYARALVPEPIPLNAGCFEPLDLVVPRGACSIPSRRPVQAATSKPQALCNLLFGAMGSDGGAHGTMNNSALAIPASTTRRLLAAPSWRGFADGIQSHMTNSARRPEVLEERFLCAWSVLRCGPTAEGPASGRGRGLERRLRFLESMTVSLLSGSRRIAPLAWAGWRRRCDHRRWRDGALRSLAVALNWSWLQARRWRF